ncbi:MAG: hydroxymyristoyl-ACP dehydratase [Flavobacteriales bacterium]|nr:hydroxymyristoyl-ACP dehydratase [Flavobacteriales bacterium]
MDPDLEQKILAKLPYAPQFLFVNGLTSIGDQSVEGHYTFSGDEPAIQGHFAEKPVIPGVILIEVMGQIGLVSHLIYLLNLHISNENVYPLLANAETEFIQTARIGEKLIVRGTMIYFRNNILKSLLEMHNDQGDIIARSTTIVKSSE